MLGGPAKAGTVMIGRPLAAGKLLTVAAQKVAKTICGRFQVDQPLT